MEDGGHRFQAAGVVSPLVSVSVHVHVAHEDYGAMRVIGVLSEVKSEVCHHQPLWVGDLVVGWIGRWVAGLPPRFGDPASV